MSAEEYWEGPPYLTKVYRKKHELDMDEQNQMLWIEGMYTYNAICTAISNLHFDGKHHKMNPYLEEPLRIRPLSEEEKEIERKAAQDKVVGQLDALFKSFNSKKQSEVR